jgi:hypothetical protein
MSRLREVADEFRTVFAGRGSLADSIIPPIVFLVINALLGLDYAVWGSLALALLITAIRLIRGQSLRYALGGLGGVALAALLAKLLDRAEGFFLPNMITGVLTIVLCGVSVIIGRPLVAWTSHVARGWPLEWYWHQKVRPAYNEVTLAWALFFAARLLVQILLLQNETLAIANVVLGWPATIVLLAASYIYGIWRLQRLRGPSIEEFKAGADPPWTGQQRGF